MDIERKVSQVNWAIYTSVGRILDEVYSIASRNPADTTTLKRLVASLHRWRRSINKMRRNSLPGRSVIEDINLSRSVKDIDSLLWRLGKIAPLVQVRVNDDSEHEEESGDE